MAKINLLDKSVAELIAAGEVIERPASVVKELVENAIDSGADAITVEIKNGGISYIRVSDNGCGIAHNEIPTAFLRHATSKLTNSDDLNSINTLGFRGEALPSIAIVAKVEILTKVSGDEFGSSYEIEGGQEKSHEKAGCPDGTTFIARDLFYNTPVRLKFLKNNTSEGNAVASVMDKLIIANPGIKFKFIRDNKIEVVTTGDGKYYSSIYSVLGSSVAKSMIPVNYTYGGITVEGFTSAPVFAKANRKLQHFFVNKRFIRSGTCSAALDEAYRNTIMTGKFPACILNITMNPADVDVNVHPAKTEVRFSVDKAVFDAIFFAVRNSILTENVQREIQIPQAEEEAQSAAVTAKSKPYISAVPVGQTKAYNTMLASNKTDYISQENLREILPQALPQVMQETKQTEVENFQYLSKSSFEKTGKSVEPACLNKKAEISVVGEVFKTYIICQADDNMLLIDKHAAHERLEFEKLKKQMTMNSQYISEPVNIQLDKDELISIIEIKDYLKRCGFEFNEAKDGVNIVGIPNFLQEKDVEDMIFKILDNINLNDPASVIYDDILHTVACKSAIKANETNDVKELEKLASDVYENGEIRYCPHGRPIITVISKKQIAKYFNRT